MSALEELDLVPVKCDLACSLLSLPFPLSFLSPSSPLLYHHHHHLFLLALNLRWLVMQSSNNSGFTSKVISYKIQVTNVKSFAMRNFKLCLGKLWLIVSRWLRLVSLLIIIPVFITLLLLGIEACC